MRIFIAAVLAAVAIVLVATFASAQDPAPGWQAWLTAQCPAGTYMTHYEATWTVPPNPPPSGAFFSPWIGSDATDNLNLIQPVNPWMGDGWSFYTEYFQWSPENNVNSNSYNTQAGNRLRGEMTFLGESAQAYKITQTDLNQGITSSQVVPVQTDSNGNYKKYTVLYAVFEKYAECYQYPPSGQVVFEDVKVFCSGKQTYPQWKSGFFQNNCNFRGHVINNDTLSITWSTSGTPLTSEQKAMNNKKPFTKKN